MTSVKSVEPAEAAAFKPPEGVAVSYHTSEEDAHRRVEKVFEWCLERQFKLSYELRNKGNEVYELQLWVSDR